MSAAAPTPSPLHVTSSFGTESNVTGQSQRRDAGAAPRRWLPASLSPSGFLFSSLSASLSPQVWVPTCRWPSCLGLPWSGASDPVMLTSTRATAPCGGCPWRGVDAQACGPAVHTRRAPPTPFSREAPPDPHTGPQGQDVTEAVPGWLKGVLVSLRRVPSGVREQGLRGPRCGPVLELRPLQPGQRQDRQVTGWGSGPHGGAPPHRARGLGGSELGREPRAPGTHPPPRNSRDAPQRNPPTEVHCFGVSSASVIVLCSSHR